MNVGDKVIIKECHKIPELVGREAKVVAVVEPELAHYPIKVMLIGDPITFETPFGGGTTEGPFGFREDELEIQQLPELPPEITKPFEE